MHNLSCMDKIRSPTLDHSSSARALSGRQCPLSFSDMCGNQQLTVIGGSPSTTRDISCLRSRRWVPITFFDSLSIVVKTFQQLASLPIKCARTNLSLAQIYGPVRKQERYIRAYTHGYYGHNIYASTCVSPHGVGGLLHQICARAIAGMFISYIHHLSLCCKYSCYVFSILLFLFH